MAYKNTSAENNKKQAGLSADTVETAPGSEILEVFMGAAIGIELPKFHGIDAGNAVDVIDEIHKERAQNEQYAIGQKKAISQDFNFGGQHYTGQANYHHRSDELENLYESDLLRAFSQSKETQNIFEISKPILPQPYTPKMSAGPIPAL